jgi:hypothetical protein
MFDILDTLAVREAVRRQPPIRRRICEWLMRDYRVGEIAWMTGRSRHSIRWLMLCIRWSFIRMGFRPPFRNRFHDPEKEEARAAQERSCCHESGASTPVLGPFGPPGS